MRRSSQVLLTILLTATLILSGIILWVLLYKQSAVPKLTVRDGKDAVVDYKKIENYVDNALESRVKNIPLPKDGNDADPVDYTIINQYINDRVDAIPHPKDGKDGLNGINGKSCTTSQTETGAVIACEDGTSAVIRNGTDSYIELRCNENRNRWEVRYAPTDNWSVLNNKSTKCTTAL